MAVDEQVTLDDVRAHLDRGGHRQALAAAYPTVVRVEQDPASASSEDWQLVTMYALATAYRGDPRRAVACATSAYRALCALHGPFDEAAMSAQRALAVAQQAAGDLLGAVRTAEAVWALSERTRGTTAVLTLLAAADLAAAQHRVGRCDEALRLMESTVDTYVTRYGHDATGIRMLARLGAMIRDCGDFDRGHELLGQARRLAQGDDGLMAAITALARADVDPDHHCTADARSWPPTGPTLAVPDDDAAHDALVDAWLSAMRDTSGHRTGDPPEAKPEGPRRAALAVLSLMPRPRHVEHDDLLAAVRRGLIGTRQVTVVNPSPGSGKTVTALMLGLTFGQARGGSVLVWDTSGTPDGLARRATRTAPPVGDARQSLTHFHANIDELSVRLWRQDPELFDVLTKDDIVAPGGRFGGAEFRALRQAIAGRYRLLIVDTGNDIAAQTWLAALDATDQLVVAVSARPDSADAAERLLDDLDRAGRGAHGQRAVVVLTMPPRANHLDVGRARADRFDANGIEARFSRRCRAVLRVPYDRHIDVAATIRSSAITPASQRSWLRVAAAVAQGL
ncbi:MAG: ParA family protein [Micromonosporaceae bacterium]|nr:ParA family protein [Micromonosporaceae bacterium]